MTFRIRALVLLGILCVFGTSCRKRIPAPTMILPEHQVFYSEESRLPEARGTVIRDAETWRRWWETITGASTAPPVVDFSSNMLLLYNAGRRQAGDRVEIFRMQPSNGELVVWYRIIEAGTPGTESYPVQVVQVRRQAGQHRFERQPIFDP